jgi:tetratricopeptide (TPR) repeat protein
VSGHYDETAMQDYLDDPEAYPERDHIESHIATCDSCYALFTELRAFDTALSSQSLWDLADAMNDDSPLAARALTDLLTCEDAEAADLLAPILGSPSAFRRANIASNSAMRTAGVVRRLCVESRTLRERQPNHALVVADAAIAIADQLPLARYPQALLDELRGDAWHERANALRYLGRHPEALDALDIAERAYTRSPAAPYFAAMLEYSRAVVRLETGKLDEALRLARKCGRVFQRFGEDERFLHARMLEGAVLFDNGAHAEARKIFLEVKPMAQNLGDPANLARVYLNVANCDLRLGELASADAHFARALSLYEALGLETERIRTRWSIGCLRVASGDVADGLARLREARGEFEALGARTDAALVTLDIAETLLATGTAAAADEAAELCAELVRSFAGVGMTGHALTAVAFLEKAFATGAVTPDLVRHVREYLESHPDHYDLPFIPPDPN